MLYCKTCLGLQHDRNRFRITREKEKKKYGPSQLVTGISVCMVIVATPGLGCYGVASGIRVLHLWYQSRDRFLAGI